MYFFISHLRSRAFDKLAAHFVQWTSHRYRSQSGQIISQLYPSDLGSEKLEFDPEDEANNKVNTKFRPNTLHERFVHITSRILDESIVAHIVHLLPHQHTYVVIALRTYENGRIGEK